LHHGAIPSIWILMNHANWFINYVVKIVSGTGSVKHRGDCAADSCDLQISKMKFIFYAVMKNDRFYEINHFEGKHPFRAEKYY
jgi:hypothetical protein